MTLTYLFSKIWCLQLYWLMKIHLKPWVKILKWYFDQIFTPWYLGAVHRISWKNENPVYCLQISALVPEIFKFEKCAKYANEMIDDVTRSTQYYTKYVNRAMLANLQHRPLKHGRLIVLKKTHLGYKKLCFHSNSLFSSPHPLDFNMIVIFSSTNIKRGQKLELTCKCLRHHLQISKWNSKRCQKSLEKRHLKK